MKRRNAVLMSRSSERWTTSEEIALQKPMSNIDAIEIIGGTLSLKEKRLVEAWAELHHCRVTAGRFIPWFGRTGRILTRRHFTIGINMPKA